jgi:hypothetical protein
VATPLSNYRRGNGGPGEHDNFMSVCYLGICSVDASSSGTRYLRIDK